MDKIICNM